MVFPQMVREHEDELGTTENQTLSQGDFFFAYEAFK
jgi:hypothetical protein